MDKDKQSLLDNEANSLKSHECYRGGMDLLYAVDQRSKLVPRFIAILERLRGDGTDENLSDTISVDIEHAAHAQLHSTAQETAYSWALNPLGPMFNSYIDFSDLDTYLTDFGDVAGPPNQAVYGLPNALH